MSNKKLSVNEETAAFKRWFKHTSLTMIQFPEMPKWIKSKINSQYDSDQGIAFIDHMIKVRKFKKTSTIDPVNTIYTVLSVNSIKLNLSANYGFIYSIDTKYNTKMTGVKNNKNPVFKNYCIAPSLVSTDGEYRNRWFKFTQFESITNRFGTIMEYIENVIAHKIERYDLSLSCENFYPQIEHEYLAEQIDHYLVDHEVQMRFFCIFWLIEIYNLTNNIQENHVNIKFNKIFFAHVDDDLQELKSMYKKFGEDLDEMISYCIQPVVTKVNTEMVLTNFLMGQKLQPLRVAEVEEPLNIYFAPWREIHLSNLTMDLIINCICPNFAIFMDWFYIKNSKKGLFDNEQQYQKIEFSERALVITKKLRETQRITYTRDDKTDERVFINSMFNELYDQIEYPIDYAKTNLIMSNVTLGFIIENVGRTFIDIPTLITSKKWTMATGDIVKNDWIFRKYVWDICYALLCINVHLGMTHSDLHLNNCTIQDTEKTGGGDKPHVLYKVNDMWYAFRTYGPYAYIIDFSRGTIHPDRAKKIPHWPNRDSYEDFVRTQNENMITKLEQTVPTFLKLNRDKIVELQRDHFDTFYKLYTAVDSYDFCTRVQKHLGKIISTANLKLVEKISKNSEHFLTAIMLKVINNPTIEIEWPHMTILRDCFTDEIFNPAEEQSWDISDFWNFDREIKYSIDKISNWPELLQKEYGIPAGVPDDRKKHILEFTKNLEQKRMDYEKYRKDQMKMVNYIARRHIEKYA